MRKLFWVVLATLAPCWGTSKYISGPNGNDAYDGLAPSYDKTHGPWKTWTKFTSVGCLPGDVIYVDYGTVLGNLNAGSKCAGTSSARVTITTYNSSNNPALLKPTATGFSTLTGKGYITVHGFAFTGTVNINATGCDINHNLISGGSSHGVVVTLTGTAAQIDDNVIALNRGYAVYGYGQAGISFTRNKVWVNGGITYPPMSAQNGAVITYANNDFGGNGSAPVYTYGTGSFVDGGGNTYEEIPTSFGYGFGLQTMITFGFDVPENFGTPGSFMDTIVRSLDPNTKITFFLEHPSPGAAAYYGALAKPCGATPSNGCGHELSLLSRSHIDLRSSDTWLVTIATTNPNPEITVTATGMTLTSSDPAKNVSLHWTQNWNDTVTVGTLIAAVKGLGWTVTAGDGTHDDVLMQVHADQTGRSFPYDMLFDYQRFLTEEVTNYATYIKATYGYTPIVGAYPSGLVDTPLRNWIMAQTSFLSYRGAGLNDGIDQLASVDAFDSSCTFVTDPIFGSQSNPDEIRAADWVFIKGQFIPLVFDFYSHGNPFDVTPQQLEAFITEAKQLGMVFTTYGAYIKDLRQNATSITNGIVDREVPLYGMNFLTNQYGYTW